VLEVRLGARVLVLRLLRVLVPGVLEVRRCTLSTVSTFRTCTSAPCAPV